MLRPPAELQRNHPNIRAVGSDVTGRTLIEYTAERLGLVDFGKSDVLDIGCGVRFSAAIVNCAIPIGSYTGLEVSRPIVDYLVQNLSERDPRFRFYHWNARNAMYNPDGVELATLPLPVDGDFDVIWLFSVITHLDPDDAAELLSRLRGYLRPGGRLFFSALIDDDLDGFDDRDPDKPLLLATYGRSTMEAMIGRAGWRIEASYPPALYIQAHFLCTPRTS